MRSSWTSTTRVVITALIILTGLFMNAIRPLISPMIIAALFAYTFYPLVARAKLLDEDPWGKNNQQPTILRNESA